MPKSKRERFIELIWKWEAEGVDYVWGGQNPDTGLDCSGMVVADFWEIGYWRRGFDLTAQGILDKLKSLAVPYPYLGCLVFWGRSLSEIKHVEVCDGEGDDEVMMCIGARKSLKKIVRTPLLAYRSGLKLLAIVDPFMQEQYKQEVI